MLAHWIARRQTTMKQRRTIRKRTEAQEEQGSCFEDNWRLAVMLGTLSNDHLSHIFFEPAANRLSSQHVKYFFEQLIVVGRVR
jgi:hypothetical protein